MISRASPIRSTACAISTLFLLSGIAPSSPRAAEPSAPLRDLRLSFKVDPRLSGPTYGGERWVSAPTYVGSNAQDIVEARAQVFDARGARVKTSPKWIPSDPEMVTVSPSEGDQVKITVKRAGESKVKVVAPGVSKEMVVRARYLGNAIQVEIAQREATMVAPPAARDASAPTAPKTQAVPALESRKKKLSYAIGMSLGQAAQEQSIELDPAVVGKGLGDVLSSKKTLLSKEEMRATMLELQKETKGKQLAAQRKAQEGVYDKNRREGEAFLAENAKKEGVVTLPSGLQYKVLRAGDGKTPTDADVVECRYRGTRADGSELDRTVGGPATLKVAETIPGLREALKLMPVGSKWQLFVPSHLAYGERGSRGRKGKTGLARKIAPNTTLVFEVELVAIEGPDGAGRQTAAATTQPAVPEN